MTRAALALGANLGDRVGQLRSAVAALADVLIEVSSVYETEPWGDPDQPAYLNAVLIVDDPRVEPRDWLDRAQALEAAAGRVRDPDRRYGPRPLDVDVIAVWRGGADAAPVTSDDPVFTVPHPRAHERAFVLVPLAEIAPDAVLPGHGPVADLLRTGPVLADLPGVLRCADIDLRPGSAGGTLRH